MIPWDCAQVRLTNDNQTVIVYVIDVNVEYAVSNNLGLAKLSIHIPGETMGTYTLQFDDLNMPQGTFLHDTGWPMPGYYAIDAVSTGSVAVTVAPVVFTEAWIADGVFGFTITNITENVTNTIGRAGLPGAVDWTNRHAFVTNVVEVTWSEAVVTDRVATIYRVLSE